MSGKKDHHVEDDNTAVMDAEDEGLIKAHEPIMQDYRRSKKTLKLAAESCVISPEQRQALKDAATRFVKRRKSDKIKKH